jgi:hypothetical protein
LLIAKVMSKPPKILPLFCWFGISFSSLPAYGQTCVVNSVSNGVLTVSTPFQLLANNTVGTPGNINITCSAGTTFTIISVINNGTPSAINNAVDGVFAAIRSGTNIIVTGEVSPSASINPSNPPGIASVIQTAPITNKDYAIDLSIFRNPPQFLPAGTYTYRINILLTPQ